MTINSGYEKQDLDKSSLQIEAGTVKKLRPEWEDYWSYNAILNEDWTQTVLTIELMKRQVDNLMKACTDLRKFLKKCGADSSFVKEIKDVIRMGGDLIEIAVDIIDFSNETPEEVIKKITGYDTDSDNGTDIDDIIDYTETKTENDIIPPLNKADIVAAAKESAKEKAEEAKEKGEDIRASSSAEVKATAAEVAKNSELVAAAENAVNDALSKVEVDATDPTISKGAVAAGVGSVTAALSNGIYQSASGIYRSGTAIGRVGKLAGDLIKGGKSAAAIAHNAANIALNIGKIAGEGLVVGLATYGLQKIIEEDKKTEARLINNAINTAGQAYLDAVQKALDEGKSLGEARKEGQTAYIHSMRTTEIIPSAHDGVIHVQGTSAAGYIGKKATQEALKEIEEQVGHAIERAGGDVTDYFGGCGCDDTCDCADCGSDCGSDSDCDCGDCSSDCGCDDTGCSGYSACDEAPSCPSDGCDCASDCPSDCASDCGSQCASDCPSDCSSDCSSDCGSDCASDCASDCSSYSACGCDECTDSPCGTDDEDWQ